VAIQKISEVPNRQFTYAYAQPGAYRFCQDSIIFSWWVAQQLKGFVIGPGFRALDVCAGCGVVGLELAHYEPRLKSFDFLEIQAEFHESFVKNLEITGRSQLACGFSFWQTNYKTLLETPVAETYDLIVGNPPYFLPNEGFASPSAVNNRCRFFIDSDFATLVRGVANALKPGAVGFLLVKSGREHGRDAIREAALLLAGTAQVDVAVEIRKTSVVRIEKAKP
jgi:tRNA1Val (adenine37-N6)-methyltransferase